MRPLPSKAMKSAEFAGPGDGAPSSAALSSTTMAEHPGRAVGA